MIKGWVERTEKRADEAAQLVRDQIATQAAAALRAEARTEKLTDEFVATKNEFVALNSQLQKSNDGTVDQLGKIVDALAKLNKKRR